MYYLSLFIGQNLVSTINNQLVDSIVSTWLTLKSADGLSWLHKTHCCRVELTGVDENNYCVQDKMLATQIHSVIPVKLVKGHNYSVSINKL